MKTLTSAAWWKDALLRALYTAIAIAVPYLGGALLTDVPWLTIGSTAALGFIASLVTSLAGIPEANGVDLPWWLAAVERVVKTFAQALLSGFVGATLISDVPWSAVLQAAGIAALVSLLRLILATLPNDPTPAIATVTPVVVNTTLASGPTGVAIPVPNATASDSDSASDLTADVEEVDPVADTDPLKE